MTRRAQRGVSGWLVLTYAVFFSTCAIGFVLLGLLSAGLW